MNISMFAIYTDWLMVTWRYLLLKEVIVRLCDNCLNSIAIVGSDIFEIRDVLEWASWNCHDLLPCREVNRGGIRIIVLPRAREDYLFLGLSTLNVLSC